MAGRDRDKVETDKSQVQLDAAKENEQILNSVANN